MDVHNDPYNSYLLAHCTKIHSDDDDNSVQFFIIYVLSQELKGQLQTQHSVDTGKLLYAAIQHRVKSKLQASTGENTY
jgi:hypothetical protein